LVAPPNSNVDIQIPDGEIVPPASAHAITAGSAVTVHTDMVFDVPHKLLTLYVILVVPANTPVNIPELLPTRATNGLLLVHVPPVAVSCKVIVCAKAQLKLAPIELVIVLAV